MNEYVYCRPINWTMSWANGGGGGWGVGEGVESHRVIFSSSTSPLRLG